VPGLEPLSGFRVVAEPAAIDAARWQGDPTIVIRSAPDEAFAIGATGVELADPAAIVVEETGFAGTWLTVEALEGHVEWALPATRPGLAQGLVAGVPARAWLADEDRALVVVQAAYVAELEARLR